MSDQQAELPVDDGLTDFERLMSKKAEDYTDEDIRQITEILRARRNLYSIEEAEKAQKKATKAVKEPKEPKVKAPAKPKSNAEKAAQALALDISDDDLLGDL